MTQQAMSSEPVGLRTADGTDPHGIGASRRPEHRRSLRGLDADMLT